MLERLYIEGMHGLGDSVYQRPFIRAAALHRRLWLMTSWPEMYSDMDVHFVEPHIQLRTQLRNIKRQGMQRWSAVHPGTQTIKNHYGKHELNNGLSILQVMETKIGLFGEAFRLDLPPYPPFLTAVDKPIAVVRPVTLRQEWLTPARAPRPEYVAQASRILANTYHVVSVADVHPPEEWYVGPQPFAHQRFDAGELTVEQILGLIQQAAVVIGGVGWIVPMAIAAGVRLGCILGGRGKHNSPTALTDARMDCSKVRWFTPDKFCQCDQALHTCNKKISRFEEQFQHWLGAPI